MARWRVESTDDVPAQVAGYDPALHGPGDRGIDAWRDEAHAWLDAHPGRVLSCGSFLGVLRTCLALKLAELDE